LNPFEDQTQVELLGIYGNLPQLTS
jgi:phosphoglycerate dehydrogenase-like enzyme